MQVKEYNGKQYRRCICDDCIKKKYPNYKGLLTCQSAFYVQYAFGVSDEDFEEAKLYVCQRTEERYIKHFGKEEGQKRWKEYCEKEAISNTFEYKQEKFGWTKEQFKEYNKSRAVTIDNLIRRHGEEKGKEMWDCYIKKQRYTTTLDYFIKTYGKKKGEEKYNNWMNKWIEAGIEAFRNKDGNFSLISQEFFENLSLDFLDHEIYYAKNGGEYRVGNYLVDYYDKTLNVVIEFFGDLFHANPKIYKFNNYIPVVNKVAKEIWERDNKRISYIEKELGCKVIIIWESDYKVNQEKNNNIGY